MLPLNPHTDVWRETQPVTKITDSLYPFDIDGKRPTKDELDHAYKMALGVLLNPANNEYQKELEPYVIQMFGKTIKEHKRMKQIVTLDDMQSHHKLHLTLIKGKDMIARHSCGKSDPYCFITIVKSEHVDMFSSAKPDVVNINEIKQLGLCIAKSRVIPKTLCPTWNQEFVFPLGQYPKHDMVLIEAWDGEETVVKLQDLHLGNVGSFLKDLGEHNSFMGRAFMPLSTVSTLPRETTLTFHSRHNKHRYGHVTIKVHLVKDTVEEAKVLKDHSLLAATVLDFESHMTGKYVHGWNAKITPLGYKLISLNAGMNGITPIQQVSVLFPLLHLYDKNVCLSIIVYFGVVRRISQHQDQLPAYPTRSQKDIKQILETSPEWIQLLIKCMWYLHAVIIGTVERHHELFSFRTEEGIRYLSLHVELLKEIYTIRPHAERLEGSWKNLKVSMHDACVVACKRWCDNLVAVVVPVMGDEKKQLLCFLEVINHTIQHLHNAVRVKDIFKEVGIDYYIIMFKTLDQQLSPQIVKYTTSYVTGGEIASYRLYLSISELLLLAEKIPSKYRRQLQLNQYHEWFKDFVGVWINEAFNKCNDEIKRAVTLIDEVGTVTENVKFSQSALSATLSFKRLITFWNNVHWPRVSECYGFVIGIVQVITDAAKLFVEENHNRLKKKDFFHDTSSKEFIVTKQLCICLNDIEYVREELSNIPEALQFDALISRLAVVEGDEQAAESHRTLGNLLSSAKCDVNSRISDVVSSVGEKMSNDITYHINVIQSELKVTKSLVKAIDPLMQYLTKNLTRFYNSLSPLVLECMLEKVWNITVLGALQNANNTRVKQDVAEILLKTVTELERFFHANGDGLPLEKMESNEYKKLLANLNVWAATDDDLIDNHLMCLANWSRSGDKDNGVLAFSVGYIQDKQTLEITVVKATNLPALSSHGPCNPYVQISLMPKGRFDIGAVKTQHKTKDVNPEYYTEFNIKVEENFLDMSGSVLTLSIYNHHLISNEFLGIAIIDGTEIPRLPSGSSNIDDPNAPQRKTYELPLVVDTMTPALEELAERSHKYVNKFHQAKKT
ncbi:BAI1-associated protein 3-like isoform X3 [Dysidea avara]